MRAPNEPTGDQCNKVEKVFETDDSVGYAMWYPQMGGYSGKCVAVAFKNSEDDKCFDCYVWHDGEFPFGDNEPVRMHHCNAYQFIDFGNKILSLFQEKT